VSKEPTLRAVLFSESLIRNNQGGLFSVVNIFARVNTQKLPMVVHALHVYLKLADMDAGTAYRLRLELRDSEDELLVHLEEEGTVQEGSQECEWGFRFPPISVKRAGPNYLTVFYNKVILGGARLMVRLVPEERGTQWL